MTLAASIDELEDEIVKKPLMDFVTTHIFKGGMYARSVFIPKGVVVTGRRHKTEHLNIVSSGSCSVTTEDTEGEEVTMEVTSPSLFSSKAGVRKVVYAHEDVIWTTVHTCTAIDEEEALKELTEDIRPSTLLKAKQVFEIEQERIKLNKLED